MSFDMEPEDPHGECAAEIHKLQAEVQEWVKLGAEQGACISALDEKLKDANLQVERLKAACEKLQASKESLVGGVYSEWNREVEGLKLQVRDYERALQYVALASASPEVSGANWRDSLIESMKRVAGDALKGTVNRVGACTRNATNPTLGHTICLKPLPCVDHDTEKRKCARCADVFAPEEHTCDDNKRR